MQRTCDRVTASATRRTGASSPSRAARAPASPPRRKLLADVARRRRGTTCCSPTSPATPRSGSRLRRIVLDPATGELSHRTEALLYAADKAEHVDRGRAARAGARRRRGHRPLRRLDAGLPGRRPRPATTEVERIARWATGRPAAAPDRAARRAAGAGLTRFDGAGPDRGGVAGVPRDGSGEMFLRLRRQAEHYLVVDARLRRSTEIAAQVVAAAGRSR